MRRGSRQSTYFAPATFQAGLDLGLRLNQSKIRISCILSLSSMGRTVPVTNQELEQIRMFSVKPNTKACRYQACGVDNDHHITIVHTHTMVFPRYEQWGVHAVLQHQLKSKLHRVSLSCILHQKRHSNVSSRWHQTIQLKMKTPIHPQLVAMAMVFWPC